MSVFTERLSQLNNANKYQGWEVGLWMFIHFSLMLVSCFILGFYGWDMNNITWFFLLLGAFINFCSLFANVVFFLIFKVPKPDTAPIVGSIFGLMLLGETTFMWPWGVFLMGGWWPVNPTSSPGTFGTVFIYTFMFFCLWVYGLWLFFVHSATLLRKTAENDEEEESNE